MNWSYFKTSNYNFLVPLEKNYLFFNALKSSLMEIDNEKGRVISTWGDGMGFEKCPDYFSDDDLKILVDNSFLILKDVDELGIIKNGHEKYKKYISDKGQFHLLVNTTNNCNMRCAYCFEGQDKKTNLLSNETIELITTKIANEIKHPKAPLKSLAVVWFGGEPLLNQKAMIQLSNNLINIASQNNILYYSNLITNGTLLSKNSWQVIKECQICEVQVSIDGDGVTHNIRRPLRSNEKSYDKIIENLRSLPNNINVHVRIHADKEVVNRLPYFLDDLEKNEIWPQNARNIHLHLSQKRYYEYNSDDKKNYFTQEEYFIEEYRFRLLCCYKYNDWAARNQKLIAGLKIKYPKPFVPLCSSATRPYSLAIDDSGFIHRCWENVNFTEDRIQHIKDYDFSFPGYDMWKNFDKTTYEKCKYCKYLPICDSTCIYHHFRDMELNCTEWKYMLPFHLKNYYQHNFTKDQKQEIISN